MAALHSMLSVASDHVERLELPFRAADSARGFCSFVDASPTPFHAVHSAKKLLTESNFQELKEQDPWAHSIQAGGKYFVTRNGSSIIAFAVGRLWKPGNPLVMVAAHTDSHSLRIKPISKKQNDGFLQVGVEAYGGGLWHTWFDRDLSIAGRVMVRLASGRIESRLVKIDEPILRIPTLAIHFGSQNPFSFNEETHLCPIAGLAAAELNRTELPTGTSSRFPGRVIEVPSWNPIKPLSERHHACVLRVVAEELAISPSDIVDLELSLYDTQKAAIGGINKELIFSARMDNLMMSFCSIMALITSCSDSSALDDETSVRLISLFDNEEEGSKTERGAQSDFLPVVIRRLSLLPMTTEIDLEHSYDRLEELRERSVTAYEEALAKSFLISADMAHSVNPNYSAYYEEHHRPEMNKGPVLKINANENYMTNSPGIAMIQEVARKAVALPTMAPGIPLQLFVVRNDGRCGGTIGPTLAAKLGVKTLDLGNPQLSMHSIRETAGRYDIDYAIGLFAGFFSTYIQIREIVQAD